MLPHRLPCAHHIATPQRGEQGLPVAEPFQPPCAAGNMHIELLPQRAAVHLQPDPLYRRQQHLVLRRPGEHQMEQTSVILRGVVESDCPLLLFNNPLQIVDIGAGGHFRGKGGDVALQQLARWRISNRPTSLLSSCSSSLSFSWGMRMTYTPDP